MGTCPRHHLHFRLHRHLRRRPGVSGVGGDPARVWTPSFARVWRPRGRAALQRPESAGRSPKPADAGAPGPAGGSGGSSAASAFPLGLQGSGREGDAGSEGAAGVSALSVSLHQSVAEVALTQPAQPALRERGPPGAPGCREGGPGDPVLGPLPSELVTQGIGRLQDDEKALQVP